jgi:hypothetical protein
MINTYKNIHVTKNHNIIIKNLPLQAGEIVDVLIIQRKQNELLRNLPLAGVPVEYNDPFEPATNPDDWEVNN